MTTTEAWRDDDEACADAADVVEAGDRWPAVRVATADRVPATGKAPPARPGITPDEAELLGDYNLHNG